MILQIYNNLRLMRKAAKRLRIVLKDGAARMKHLQEEGTDLELLIGFCWYTDLVASWVDFCVHQQGIFEKDDIPLLKENNQIYRLYYGARHESIYEVIKRLRTASFTVSAKRFCSFALSSGGYNTKDLEKAMPSLIKIRGLLKMGDHDYGIEVPEIICEFSSEEGLSSIQALNTGDHLLKSYKNLIEKMTPIVVQFQFQQLFDRNCNLIQAVYNAEIERVA